MNRNKIGGSELAFEGRGGSELAFEGRFRSNFGASPQVAARVWDLIQQEQADTLTHLHSIERFLWALLLLKSYDTENVNAARALGVHEDTFRQWAWDFVERICDLEAVVVSCSSFDRCLLLLPVRLDAVLSCIPFSCR